MPFCRKGIFFEFAFKTLIKIRANPDGYTFRHHMPI